MNTLVSFELAKLLKEKGFNKKCTAFYDLTSNTQIDNVPPGKYNLTKQSVSLPTITEVVMWLHEKHGLWTNVMYMGFELKYAWSVDVVTTSGSDWDSYGEEGDVRYNSPAEAYETAIKYILQNLTL